MVCLGLHLLHACKGQNQVCRAECRVSIRAGICCRGMHVLLARLDLSYSVVVDCMYCLQDVLKRMDLSYSLAILTVCSCQCEGQSSKYSRINLLL